MTHAMKPLSCDPTKLRGFSEKLIVTRRALLAVLVAIPLCAGAAGKAPFDTAAIEQATGLKGTYVEKEGVFKIGSPRNDVNVSVDGKRLPPFMGLGVRRACETLIDV